MVINPIPAVVLHSLIVGAFTYISIRISNNRIASVSAGLVLGFAASLAWKNLTFSLSRIWEDLLWEPVSFVFMHNEIDEWLDQELLLSLIFFWIVPLLVSLAVSLIFYRDKCSDK